MISPTRLPPFRSILPFSIFLAVTGWLGMVLVVLSTLPTLGPRWLFFFFIVLALTGTFLPLIFYLNIRFPSYSPIGIPVVIRQACWVGVYGGIIAWLQLGRILTTGLGVAIAIGLLVVEWLIRFREKNKWKPGRQANIQHMDEEDDLENGE
ncbi:MAG: hypothetical protein C0391_03540 [Anaerolinea sp.]|nr:hypothetical protein [Anaerolinea sp.]